MQPYPILKKLFRFISPFNLLVQITAPALIIALAIIFQIDSLNQSREQQLTRTRLAAQDLGSTLSASLNGAFQNIDLTLLAATDHARTQSSSDNFQVKKFSTDLSALQQRVPALLTLRATNDIGDIIFDASVEDEQKVNIADRRYFQTLKSNSNTGMVISEPLVGRYSKKWVVICARRYNLAHGQFGGIVYGSIELDGLAEKLTGKKIKLNDNDVVVLRDEMSNIILRLANGKQDLQAAGVRITSPDIAEFDKSATTSASFIATSAVDHVKRIFYLQRLHDQPMSIIVGLSSDDALRAWRAEERKSWLNTCLFSLVVAIGFFLLHLEQARKAKVIRALEKTREDLTQLIRINEAILVNSPLPIGVYSASGHCITVNEALAELTGTTRDVLLNQNFYQIASWKESGLLDACKHALAKNTHDECDIHLVTGFGKEVNAVCHIQSVWQNQENLLLIQFVDLTEIKLVNSKLENILKSMNEGVHVIGAKGDIILQNDAATKMFGWHADDIMGRPAHSTMHHHHADYSFFPVEACPIYATLSDGQLRHVEDDVFWRKDGTFFPVEYTATPIMNLHGAVSAVTVVFRDITYRKRLEDELRRQATHDVLTGLPNRRLLMDRLDQAISANRRHHTHGALLFLDLDKFKDLNDLHGHEAGDHLLIEVARRLLLVIRQSDSVARLGGDEFVVLLLGLDAEYDLAKKYVDIVAEKISRRLRDNYALGAISHQSSASIGIKIFYDSDIPEKILKDADLAMYRMKKLRD